MDEESTKNVVASIYKSCNVIRHIRSWIEIRRSIH